MHSLRKKLALTLRNISKTGKLALIVCTGLTQGALAETLPIKVAQITPAQNGTATEVVVTNTEDAQESLITGGQASSDNRNLFHSFDEFNIGTGDTASFITAPTIQNVLSHITGGPSSINGLLQVLGSEADLYLINPSGILFGPDVHLNLPGSFTAVTATDVAFGEQWLSEVIAGETGYGNVTGSPTAYAFSGSSPVVNLGNLTLGTGESLTVMGNTIVNTGNISVPGGNITINAVEGSQLVRIAQGNQLLSLEVLPEDRSVAVAPQTLGELLTGETVPYADQLIANADGSVSLLSTQTQIPETGGVAIVSGELSANGEQGGEVNVFGDRVALLDGTLSATGHDSGGTIRFGGDYQGSALAPTATHAYVSASSELNADAEQQGNGGQIFVWSDELTQFYGSLSARGGLQFGDGGFGEISGKVNLDYQGNVDLGASAGDIGTLLFDPVDITITQGSGTYIPPLPLSFPRLLQAEPGSFVIYEDTLESLNSDVVFQAKRYIEIESLSDGELTFQPGVNILFQSDVDNSGTGGFSMNEDHTIRAPGGNVRIISGSAGNGVVVGHIDTRPVPAQTESGNIFLQAQASDVDAKSLTTGDRGTITIYSNDDINVQSLSTGSEGTIEAYVADVATVGDISIGRDSVLEVYANNIDIWPGNTTVFGDSGSQLTFNSTLGIDISNTVISGDTNITLNSNRNISLTDSTITDASVTVASGRGILSQRLTGNNADIMLNSAQEIRLIDSGFDGSNVLVESDRNVFLDQLTSENSDITLNSDREIQLVDSSVEQSILNANSDRDIVVNDLVVTGANIALNSNNDVQLENSLIHGSNINVSGGRSVAVDNSVARNTSDLFLESDGNISIGFLEASDSFIITNSDDIEFTGGADSISANRLTIEPGETTTDVYVGQQGPADALSLSVSDITAISSNTNAISIGRRDATSSTYLSAAIADSTGNGFTSSVRLQGNVSSPEATTLAGPDTDTTWQISGQNSGSISGYSNLTFQNFGNIAGKGDNTTVQFNNAAAEITNSIDSGNGNLTLVGDRITTESITGNGDFLLRTLSPGTPIILGGNSSPTALHLSDANLASIGQTFNNSITFGDEFSGPLSLGTSSFLSSVPLTLRSGATIDTTAGTVVTGNQSPLTLSAPNGITAGYLTALGGDISLTSEGSISATAISALATSAPAPGATNGGDITVDTDGLFEVTGYLGGTNVLPSIATGSDGTIDIRHGGNGEVPFTVGSATSNGTLGRITNGTNTIENEVSLYDFGIPGEISIRTDAVPPEPSVEALEPSTPETPAAIIPSLTFDNSDNSLSLNLTNEEEAASQEIFSRIEAAAGAQFAQFLSLNNRTDPSEIATLRQVQETLKRTESQLSTSPALLYVYFVPSADASASVTTAAEQAREFLLEGQPDDQLEVMLIGPNGAPIRHRQWGITRAQVEAVATDLRHQSTSQFSRPQAYLVPAQQLYSWIIQPFAAELDQLGTDNLAFIMDDGLRTLPIAVLHDGEQFLIENYSLGLMPTFSLTGLATQDFRVPQASGERQVLAMGASRFKSQPPLPAVEAELSLVAEDLWVGESFLNEAFTLNNLKAQLTDSQYSLLHLATHAVFESGDWDNSYIQLWDQKVTLAELSELGLSDRDLELIILSACNTALGDRSSEYGFAGFAVNAGSQSALASLWPVSDEGTLGFMSQFYQQLSSGSLRAESLRQAQLDMLRGNVSIQAGRIIGPSGDTLANVPELLESGSWDFSHPFYWSAFTMIGNPW